MCIACCDAKNCETIVIRAQSRTMTIETLLLARQTGQFDFQRRSKFFFLCFCAPHAIFQCVLHIIMKCTHIECMTRAFSHYPISVMFCIAVSHCHRPHRVAASWRHALIFLSRRKSWTVMKCPHVQNVNLGENVRKALQFNVFQNT